MRQPKHTTFSPHHFFRQAGFCVAALFGVLLWETSSNGDIAIQNLLFDTGNNGWWLSPIKHEAWRWLFYDGLKRGLTVFGLCALFVLLLSLRIEKLRSVRTICIKIIVALCFIPLLISTLKLTTHVPCPRSLVNYGGSLEYVKLLDHPPLQSTGTGRCFPAGHASGGFALFILCFCGAKGEIRYSAASLGMIAGWTAGVYQMARGEHFMSHTLVSMILAWLICLIINELVDTTARRQSARVNAAKSITLQK